MQIIKITVKYCPLSSICVMYAKFWKLALIPSPGKGLLIHRQMTCTCPFFVVIVLFALAVGVKIC